MGSGTGNDQYSLIEYELARLVHTMMVLVVNPSCISSRFNRSGLLRTWKVQELPLKEASECGLAPDFSQYFAISGSALAQQFYITSRHGIRSSVIEFSNGMTERAAIPLNLAPFCPDPIRHGNHDLLGEMVVFFGSALAS